MTDFEILGEPKSETESYKDIEASVQRIGGFEPDEFDGPSAIERANETRKYFALYEAVCTLALIVERVEMGFPQTADSHLIVDAKRELRQVAALTHSDFFTKFERAFRIDRE